MKKLFIIFSLIFISVFNIYSFDLIVPSAGDESYVLMDGDDEFIVDDSVYMKYAFDHSVNVERFSDTITLISYDDEEMLVLLNATEDDLDGQKFMLRFSVDEPDVLIVNSPIDFELLEEIDADDLYISGLISPDERAMLRRMDMDFVELDISSILRLTRDGISVISGNKNNGQNGGFYVSCPNCGTMIYVPLQ